MSQQREQELKDQIKASQDRTEDLQAALKTIQDKPLPLAFMAEWSQKKRLCIKITDSIRRTVSDPHNQYITLKSNGHNGYGHIDNIKREYIITEVIFD